MKKKVISIFLLFLILLMFSAVTSQEVFAGYCDDSDPEFVIPEMCQ